MVYQYSTRMLRFLRLVLTVVGMMVRAPAHEATANVPGNAITIIPTNNGHKTATFRLRCCTNRIKGNCNVSTAILLAVTVHPYQDGSDLPLGFWDNKYCGRTV